MNVLPGTISKYQTRKCNHIRLNSRPGMSSKCCESLLCGFRNISHKFAEQLHFLFHHCAVKCFQPPHNIVHPGVVETQLPPFRYRLLNTGVSCNAMEAADL